MSFVDLITTKIMLFWRNIVMVNKWTFYFHFYYIFDRIVLFCMQRRLNCFGLKRGICALFNSTRVLRLQKFCKVLFVQLLLFCYFFILWFQDLTFRVETILWPVKRPYIFFVRRIFLILNVRFLAVIARKLSSGDLINTMWSCVTG